MKNMIPPIMSHSDKDSATTGICACPNFAIPTLHRRRPHVKNLAKADHFIDILYFQLR